MRKNVVTGLFLQFVVWALILYGWGFDDLIGFFARPARTVLLIGAVLATVIVSVACPDFDPFRKGEKPVGSQRWMLGFLAVVTLFSAWFMPYADRRGLLVFRESDSIRYVGLALNVIGGTLRLAGFLALGRQFSGYVTVQQNHQLVQTGVYRVIRHPMYLGVLLAFPGAALVFRSWVVFPMFLVFAVLLGVRVQQEEKLLAEHFGAEFEAYRRRTWRLIPFVY